MLREVNEPCTSVVNYRQCRLLKILYETTMTCSTNNVLWTLRWLPMKNQTFGVRDPVSIFSFKPESKATCCDWHMYEVASFWILMQIFTSLVEPNFKDLVTLPTQTSKARGGCVPFYNTFVNFLVGQVCRYHVMTRLQPGDIDHVRQILWRGTTPKQGWGRS